MNNKQFALYCGKCAKEVDDCEINEHIEHQIVPEYFLLSFLAKTTDQKLETLNELTIAVVAQTNNRDRLNFFEKAFVLKGQLDQVNGTIQASTQGELLSMALALQCEGDRIAEEIEILKKEFLQPPEQIEPEPILGNTPIKEGQNQNSRRQKIREGFLFLVLAVFIVVSACFFVGLGTQSTTRHEVVPNAKEDILGKLVSALVGASDISQLSKGFQSKNKKEILQLIYQASSHGITVNYDFIWGVCMADFGSVEYKEEILLECSSLLSKGEQHFDVSEHFLYIFIDLGRPLPYDGVFGRCCSRILSTNYYG